MSFGRRRDVGVAEAVALARDGYRVLDVREPHEWESGHVAGATHLPLGEVVARIAETIPDRSTRVLVHCAHGRRSALASEWLAQLGYADVVNLDGAIEQWAAAGGAWVDPEPQTSRYARQIALPEVGPEGQARLRDARVAIVGAGGLGSPVAMYLAAAGIGTLAIADGDAVEESNLHRQVLHGADRIGMPKPDSAGRTLGWLNGDVTVVPHRERVTAGNAERVLDGYDVVVDATDSLDARYALNDAAVRLGTPLVHGSVHRWEGTVTTIVPFEGPCYRCLHPAQPPAELAPDCDATGVIGVVPGIVGLLQANEVMKLLLRVGEPLVGRLLVFDALRAAFDEIAVPRDPACAACGQGAVAAVAAASGAIRG